MELTKENLKDFGIIPEGHVVIPVGITEIGEKAFFNCRELVSVTIPNTVKSIGNSAFEECVSLECVELPDRLVTIGNRAFWCCPSLLSINLPYSLASIGDAAFNGCYDLKLLKFPRCVQLGKNVFEYTSGLTLVVPPTWNSSDPEFYYVGQVIYQEPEKCIDQIVLTRDDIAKYNIIPVYGETVIPKEVRDNDGNWHEVIGIGTGAFYNRKDLNSVKLPARVSIATGAFMGCTNAEICVPRTTLSIADHAFDDAANISYFGNQPGAPWGANDLNFSNYGEKGHFNEKEKQIS